MNVRRVVFVASNDTHVHTFAPVLAYMAPTSATTTVVSLDRYYRQNASGTAAALGVDFVEMDRSRAPVGPVPFYGRHPMAVWFDVLAARRKVRALLTALAPTTVVVGNDRGLIEKLILHTTRKDGVRTVLLQDGRLGPRPRPLGIGGHLGFLVKRTASSMLGAIGAPYLAAGDYGGGGADVICASGHAGAAVMAQRKRPWSQIVVTGQPRYDSLPRKAAVPAWDLVYFTTPFAVANLGTAYQRRQLGLVRRLAGWAAQTGARFAVKPHPREDFETYTDCVGSDAVLRGPASSALAQTDLALVGVSTVMEEAALIGCPILVVGEVVHGTAFDGMLPDRHVYPRADSVDDVTNIAHALRNEDARSSCLSRQRLLVSKDVLHDPGFPAAANVVEVLLG